MPLGDVVLRILGRDETADAVRSAEGNLDELEAGWGRRWARMALAAAAAIAGTLEKVAELGRMAEDRLAGLDRAIGARSSDVRALRAQLIGLGADPTGGEESIRDIVAAVDAQLGGAGSADALPTALALAQFGHVTGVRQPRLVGQVAAGFGLEAGAVPPLLNLLAAQSSTRNLPAETLLTGLREYGPVLAQAGLSAPESLEFIADLESAGVSISRVSPALNAAIRRSALEGETPRAILAAEFGAIAAAESDAAAVAVGTPTFGAEGTLRLVQAIRRGGVGLDSGALSLAHLGDAATLGTLAAPTASERIAAGRRILAENESALVRTAVAVEGGIGALPLLGDAYSGLIDELIAHRRAQDVAPQTIVNVYGSLLDSASIAGTVQREAPDAAPPDIGR